MFLQNTKADERTRPTQGMQLRYGSESHRSFLPVYFSTDSTWSASPMQRCATSRLFLAYQYLVACPRRHQQNKGSDPNIKLLGSESLIRSVKAAVQVVARENQPLSDRFTARKQPFRC